MGVLREILSLDVIFVEYNLCGMVDELLFVVRGDNGARWGILREPCPAFYMMDPQSK